MKVRDRIIGEQQKILENHRIRPAGLTKQIRELSNPNVINTIISKQQPVLNERKNYYKSVRNISKSSKNQNSFSRNYSVDRSSSLQKAKVIPKKKSLPSVSAKDKNFLSKQPYYGKYYYNKSNLKNNYPLSSKSQKNAEVNSSNPNVKRKRVGYKELMNNRGGVQIGNLGSNSSLKKPTGRKVNQNQSLNSSRGGNRSVSNHSNSFQSAESSKERKIKLLNKLNKNSHSTLEYLKSHS